MLKVKLSVIVAALLVPAFVVSTATAAPKKKKKHKSAKPTTSATVTPADTATPAPAPVATPAPVAAPAPAPVITSTTTTTSATVPAAAQATPRPVIAAAEMPGEPDKVQTPKNRDPLGDGLSIAPIAEYGTSALYRAGVGARMGYTIPAHVYLGGTFVYHTGGSSGPLSYTFYYMGPEAGYDIAMGPVVLRPYVGGGFGSLQTSYKGTQLTPGGGGAGASTTFTGRSQSAVIWPGASLLVPVSNNIALGADVRVIFAPGQNASQNNLPSDGQVSLVANNTSVPPSTALAAGLTAAYRF